MSGVAAILWKDWKEMLQIGTGHLRGPLPYFTGMTIIGVVLALQVGPAFLTSWRTVYLIALMAALAVSSVVSDAIAGERERHTLETLLASRISRREVFVGKLAAAVLHGWMLAWLMVAVGTLTTVVRNGLSSVSQGASVLAVSLLLSLLLAVFIGALGILLSLRAATARQAQQSFMLALMFAFVAPYLLSRALPAGLRDAIATGFAGIEPEPLVAVLSVALILLDAAVVHLALRRFGRVDLLSDP